MYEAPIGKTMKILVVHRQHVTVDFIKLVLRGCNPVVLYAESGLDGLLTSRIEHFDVIICGTNLPVVTGFELVRSIRNNSVNHDTPVIFLYDDGQEEEKIKQLSKSLGAVFMLATDEIEYRLADVVAENVATPCDKVWSALQTKAVKE